MLRSVVELLWVPYLLTLGLYAFQLGYPAGLRGPQLIVMTATIWFAFSISIVYRSGWKPGMNRRLERLSAGRGHGMPGLVESILEPAQDEIQVVREEIRQVSGLLESAIRELNDCFLEINEHSSGQERSVRELFENTELDPADSLVRSTLERISERTADLNRGIGTAIRSLQFEDIARQVLDKASRHTHRLEDYLQSVRVSICQREGIDLESLEKDLVALRVHVSEEIHRVAEQKTTREGAVELF